MIPGMNPRQMKQAMKKLGMEQEEIDAIAVIIRTEKEDIIIRDPSVQKINMAGNKSYQVSGEEEIRPVEQEVEISEEDIKTVMEQSNCTEKEAEKALENNDGDLAAAIMELQKE